jgi:hypothetical protein
MSVALPISIFPSPNMTLREKLLVMKDRQRVLSEAAINVLRTQWYVIGESLKIPGAFAFETRWRRTNKKIGIKTSADRAVALTRDTSGGWGLLSRVDQVFVATWDQKGSPSRSKLPMRFQVYLFDPKKLIEVASQVYAKADDRSQSGIQWIPLDSDRANGDSTNLAAGSLSQHGRLIFDEPIEWISERVEGEEVLLKQDAEESVPALRLTIAEAKAGLAAQFGVKPDAIKIIIEG